jgi:hypothetical protein
MAAAGQLGMAAAGQIRLAVVTPFLADVASATGRRWQPTAATIQARSSWRDQSRAITPSGQQL